MPSAGTFCPKVPSKGKGEGSYSYEGPYDSEPEPEPEPTTTPDNTNTQTEMGLEAKLVAELLRCAERGDEACLEELIVFMSKNTTATAIWELFPPELWTGGNLINAKYKSKR